MRVDCPCSHLPECTAGVGTWVIQRPGCRGIIGPVPPPLWIRVLLFSFACARENTTDSEIIQGSSPGYARKVVRQSAEAAPANQADDAPPLPKAFARSSTLRIISATPAAGLASVAAATSRISGAMLTNACDDIFTAFSSGGLPSTASFWASALIVSTASRTSSLTAGVTFSTLALIV